MEEFIGKKLKVIYFQEIGWKRPTVLIFDKKVHRVKKIIAKWEEHTLIDPWWQRRHRIWYEVLLEDENIYQIYWDKRSKNWFLIKKISKE